MSNATRDLGFARVDLDRVERRGYPEAIYAPGKQPEQVVQIVAALWEAGQHALVTRADEETFEAVRKRFSKAEWHETAQMIVLRRKRVGKPRPGLTVLCAGTSDIPVAEEAALTAETMGVAVERRFDVGVAGLQRLLEQQELLRASTAIVVVAGMDGALASVVAGLVACPVIGVPTSRGYGAGADGSAALLTMLNACAPGVAVVNIDNGYGAGYLGATIVRPVAAKKSAKKTNKRKRRT